MSDDVTAYANDVREALAVYDRYMAGSRSDQALGRAVTDEMVRRVRQLLSALFLADLERGSAHGKEE
jgi:hypothetical protein